MKPVAKAAKNGRASRVEEYEEEEEPKKKAKPVAKPAAKRQPPAPKINVKGLDKLDLVLVGDANPARPPTKRWAIIEAMARVPRDGMGKKGAGSVDNLKKEATRLLTRLAKLNPNVEIDTDFGKFNVLWFGKNGSALFKNGSATKYAVQFNEAKSK